MGFRTVSIKRFREEVNAIEDDFARNLTIIGYLTAARASELCTKATPWELLNGKTRPYGQFMRYEFQKFELTPREDPSLREPISSKVFVITSAVARRGKRLKREQPDDDKSEITTDEIRETLTKYGQTRLLDRWQKNELEIDPLIIRALQGKLVFKSIELPASTAIYDPWIWDVLKYYQKHGEKLTFDHTRQYFTQTFRRALKGLLPPKSPRTPKNLLRHYRLSHLLNYYQFDPVQLSIYSGWTIKTALDKQGFKVNSNIDFYMNKAWCQYFRKLLVPIDELIR